MVQLYVLSILAGLLVAYAVPLFVDGILGHSHRSPIRRASALVSVVSGWILVAVAAVLLHFAHPWGHEYRASGLFALGALVMAVYLASWSASHAAER